MSIYPQYAPRPPMRKSFLFSSKGTSESQIAPYPPQIPPRPPLPYPQLQIPQSRPAAPYQPLPLPPTSIPTKPSIPQRRVVTNTESDEEAEYGQKITKKLQDVKEDVESETITELELQELKAAARRRKKRLRERKQRARQAPLIYRSRPQDHIIPDDNHIEASPQQPLVEDRHPTLALPNLLDMELQRLQDADKPDKLGELDLWLPQLFLQDSLSALPSVSGQIDSGQPEPRPQLAHNPIICDQPPPSASPLALLEAPTMLAEPEHRSEALLPLHATISTPAIDTLLPVLAEDRLALVPYGMPYAPDLGNISALNCTFDLPPFVFDPLLDQPTGNFSLPPARQMQAGLLEPGVEAEEEDSTDEDDEMVSGWLVLYGQEEAGDIVRVGNGELSAVQRRF